MARLFFVDSTALKLACCTEQAVGKGCPNRLEDVLLVQFFLKVISEGPQRDLYSPRGSSALNIDGLWGPLSQTYLDQYVSSFSNLNTTAALRQDGRVDAPQNGRIVGSKSGNLYSILALNVSYMKARGLNGLPDFSADPLFPQRLRPSIKLAM